MPLKDWTGADCCGRGDLKTRGMLWKKIPPASFLSKSYPFLKVALNPGFVCRHCSDHSSTNWCPLPTPGSDSRVHMYSYNYSALHHVYISDSSQLAVLDCYLSFCAHLLSQGYCEQINAFTSFISMSSMLNCWVSTYARHYSRSWEIYIFQMVGAIKTKRLRKVKQYKRNRWSGKWMTIPFIFCLFIKNTIC